MYNTCETGCCSTNVPVRDSSHAKCHCSDTHWCESPVITKRVSNCDDGCCTSSTTSIQNSDQVMQYVNGLRDEHLGHSEHDLNKTIRDISKPSNTCCTPHPPSCGCNSCCTTGSSCGCQTDSCDCGCGPALHYEELNCSTTVGTCCSSDNNIGYIQGLANRVRGSMNHRCHTYGNICETIKEIPAANVFLVNHEFVDLLIDEILDCLPECNLSRQVVTKVKAYVKLYYVHYKDIETVGSLLLNNVIPIEQSLIADELEAERIKAVLYALQDRLEGRVNGYEQ